MIIVKKEIENYDLRTKRRAKGITQFEIARAMGLSRTTVSYLENNTIKATAETGEKIKNFVEKYDEND